jgi:hypothetical protein
MPNQTQLSTDEAYRINRARLAVKLHKLPGELDEMPLKDFADLVEVMRMDDTLAEMDAAKRRSQTKRKRR